MNRSIGFVVLVWVFIQGLYAAEPVITVTNQNIAFVRETRSLDIRKGAHAYIIADLPALLDPSTCMFSAKNIDFQVLENYFEYGLSDLNGLLAQAINANITAVSDQGTIYGKLLSFNDRFLFLESSDSVLQAIVRSAQTRISFDDTGDNYSKMPTVWCKAEASNSGPKEINMSYLTRGMGWEAVYTALYNEAAAVIDLAAQVAISNTSGKSFHQARLRLLAGELHEVQSYTAPRFQKAMAAEAMSVAGAGEPESLSEFKIYDLVSTADLPDQQTRFIRFINPGKVNVTKQYIYDPRIDVGAVNVSLTAMNDKSSGLGTPLPKGTVRIYMADKQTEYIGADHLEHTAVDEKITIKIGQAYDVKAERKILEQKKVSKNAEQITVQVELRNHKDEAVEILVVEAVPYYRTYEIIKSSHPVTEKEARKIGFKIPVSAKKTEMLTFTILFSW